MRRLLRSILVSGLLVAQPALAAVPNDLQGWDFVDRDAIAEPDPVAGDEQDAIIHGTAIAGVIGAIGNNGEGVAGIAWRVRLMSVRILDNGGAGESGDATEALRYAVKNGADVINVSFTGFEVDETFRAAVRDAYEAGVVIVAAVGNRSNGGAGPGVDPLYPRCFVADRGGDWVLGVAATTAQDTKALFSNY